VGEAELEEWYFMKLKGKERKKRNLNEKRKKHTTERKRILGLCR